MVSEPNASFPEPPPSGRVPRASNMVESMDNAGSSSCFLPSSERVIIVANTLPVTAVRQNDNKFAFFWDSDSLLLQLKDSLKDRIEVFFVGCLNSEIDPQDYDSVAATLLAAFNCVPAFLDSDLWRRYYHGFCKQQLWPLIHYMLPLTPALGGRFDKNLWQAYVSVNKIFADKVMEVITPDEDSVWIHDYHLMLLPTFLRNRFHKIKVGFFLHSPFPSSEIYRTLPVREEILRGLLNADLIGFHTFDYARHFLSCCSRMLGLEYESKRGFLSLEYYGRNVGVKIMPVGIHMSQLEAAMNLEDTKRRITDLQAKYTGKIVLVGVDDMDMFKGIGLKLLAVEHLLVQNPELVGKVVMVQILNPPRGRGKVVTEVHDEVYGTAMRMNALFGNESYQPVELIERHVPLYERIAYYTIAECCVVSAVRDGMNLIPYEYIVSRQGLPEVSSDSTVAEMPPKKSMLVISEFIGCSPSLSGAIRVNPWNIEAMADAINTAITMPDAEKHMRHENHFRYVSTHDVAFWAQSFTADLQRICKEYNNRRCYGLGFGLRFRVVSLDHDFRKLSTEHILWAYKKSSSRAILLDYDGTMKSQASIDKTPSQEILAILSKLCNDPKNVVFLVSGRGRQVLNDWFSPCKKLGIAAEHGYFIRWNFDEDWETSVQTGGFGWKAVVTPIFKLYTECTDGSFVETKESALVWHFQDADPDFGSWQAKELLDHLESVLANEPVEVKSGQQIVEVKPQGVSKGIAIKKLLTSMATKENPPDFVLCIGDDRSDEDMFDVIENATETLPKTLRKEIFPCTVGQKPSMAKYYLDDTLEVRKMLLALATASELAIEHSLPNE